VTIGLLGLRGGGAGARDAMGYLLLGGRKTLHLGYEAKSVCQLVVLHNPKKGDQGSRGRTGYPKLL
jgi:hypothetical protein